MKQRLDIEERKLINDGRYERVRKASDFFLKSQNNFYCLENI